MCERNGCRVMNNLPWKVVYEMDSLGIQKCVIRNNFNNIVNIYDKAIEEYVQFFVAEVNKLVK